MEVTRRTEVAYARVVHQYVDELVDHGERTVIVDIMAELGLLEDFPSANKYTTTSEDMIPLEPETMPNGTKDHSKRYRCNLNNVARL